MKTRGVALPLVFVFGCGALILALWFRYTGPNTSNSRGDADPAGGTLKNRRAETIVARLASTRSGSATPLGGTGGRFKIPSGSRLLRDEMRVLIESSSARGVLSAEDLAAVSEIFADYQNARSFFEGAIAVKQYSPQGDLELRVPVYPEEGKLLREMFGRDLEAAIGAKEVACLDAAIGEKLDQKFRGYGTTEQLIRVKSVRDPNGNLYYQIQREVRAIFSAIPIGKNPEDYFHSSMSTYSVYPEQLATGEWAGFAASISELGSH